MTQALGPLDTLLNAAITQSADALFGEPGRPPYWFRVNVAMTATRVVWRSEVPLLDAGKVAWNTLHKALVDAAPRSAWPMGFTLRGEHDKGSWRPVSLQKVHAFGAPLNPKTAGLDIERSYWWARPLGMDALMATLAKLDTVWAPSNQDLRSWSQAHNLMSSAFVSSDRVVARTEVEALVKFAWLRDGMDGVKMAADERDTNCRTWMVATEIAEPDTDPFAKPPTIDRARSDLRARLEGLDL